MSPLINKGGALFNEIYFIAQQRCCQCDLLSYTLSG
jgi:hypothetical protein